MVDPSHEQSIYRVAHGDGSPSIRVLPLTFAFENAEGPRNQLGVGEGARLIAQSKAFVHYAEKGIG